MVKFSAKVTGARKIQKELRRLKRHHAEAVAAAVFLEAMRIFAVSQTRVPVDTGRLRASGAVSPAGRVFNFRAIVSYGTNYALSVHERVEVPHVVGEAKYLDKPFREAIPGMMGRIAADAEKFASQVRVERPTRARGEKRGR